jgi:hypothetical protein
MRDDALTAFVSKRAAEMSRQELEASYVELMQQHYRLSMSRAEIQGETIGEMRRLLHNARTLYSDILIHHSPLMSFGELEKEIDQIAKIIDATD